MDGVQTRSSRLCSAAYLVKPKNCSSRASANISRVVPVLETYALQVLRPGDVAIDATAGNGADTLALARMVGADGVVHGIDVQVCRAALQRGARCRELSTVEDLGDSRRLRSPRSKLWQRRGDSWTRSPPHKQLARCTCTWAATRGCESSWTARLARLMCRCRD